jgi:hypothetical protein
MKYKVFWYLTEAIFLAMYITFFAFLANNIWWGILAGVLFVVLRNLVHRALDKVKIGE